MSSTTNDNDDFKLGDDLFRLYLAELKIRGYNYFQKLSAFPQLTGGLVTPELIDHVLLSLSLNKGLTTLMLQSNPREVIDTILFDGMNASNKDHWVDLLDDISLNVRLRNSELYDHNKAILIAHLVAIADNQTVMTQEQRKVFDDAMAFYDSILLTLHYLRKIGYNNVLK